jgi:NADH:ubiquinone oxidoreductase subunit 2 (subunit N)
MTSPKQIRYIAIGTLAIGMVLAVGSGWFNREARLALDPALAQRASSAASMLFTLTGIFILIGGFEFQRARTIQRLNRLEREIESLKHRGVSANS